LAGPPGAAGGQSTSQQQRSIANQPDDGEGTNPTSLLCFLSNTSSNTNQVKQLGIKV
jgi:hypothetical protein